MSNFIHKLLHKGEEPKVTEEEIKNIVQESAEDGEISEVEQDIVERVLNLSDRTIGSLMTHRSELIWLDDTKSTDDIRQTIRSNVHNVYPVAHEELDEITGVVLLKDLFLVCFEPTFNLSEIIKPAFFLSEDTDVYNALDSLKQNNVHYALVANEFGNIEGIVTMNDILEAMIGEYKPSTEDDFLLQQQPDGTYVVDGQFPFYDFLSHFDLQDLFHDHNFNTLSGLILDELKFIPKEGEYLTWQNFRLTVLKMDAARIDKVKVELLEQAIQHDKNQD